MHRRRRQGGPYLNHAAACPFPSPPAPCPVDSRSCGSCASLRVALHGEEESRPTLTLAFILGPSVVATASLPFACGSDGGCSSRLNGGVCVTSSVISGAVRQRNVARDACRRGVFGGVHSHITKPRTAAAVAVVVKKPVFE